MSELAATIPVDILERVLVLLAMLDFPHGMTPEDVQAIKVVDREIRQVKALCKSR